jgi:hypothetical protein
MLGKASRPLTFACLLSAGCCQLGPRLDDPFYPPVPLPPMATEALQGWRPGSPTAATQTPLRQVADWTASAAPSSTTFAAGGSPYNPNRIVVPVLTPAFAGRGIWSATAAAAYPRSGAPSGPACRGPVTWTSEASDRAGLRRVDARVVTGPVEPLASAASAPCQGSQVTEQAGLLASLRCGMRRIGSSLFGPDQPMALEGTVARADWQSAGAAEGAGRPTPAGSDRAGWHPAGGPVVACASSNVLPAAAAGKAGAPRALPPTPAAVARRDNGPPPAPLQGSPRYADRWEDYFYAAVSLAKDMGRAQRADHLPRPECDELIQAYGDLAMDLLQQAVHKGLHDARQVRQEPALAPLRPRPDFQELLRALDRPPAWPLHPAVAIVPPQRG